MKFNDFFFFFTSYDYESIRKQPENRYDDPVKRYPFSSARKRMTFVSGKYFVLVLYSSVFFSLEIFFFPLSLGYRSFLKTMEIIEYLRKVLQK